MVKTWVLIVSILATIIVIIAIMYFVQRARLKKMAESGKLTVGGQSYTVVKVIAPVTTAPAPATTTTTTTAAA